MCVDNTVAGFFGCECDENFFESDSACVPCSTICDGCSPDDGLCEECITGASRILETIGDLYGDCECDPNSFFDNDMCSPCDTICDGCSPVTGTCKDCIINAERVC